MSWRAVASSDEIGLLPGYARLQVVMSVNIRLRLLIADDRLEKLPAAFAYHVPVAHL
jgi:hypothetical protein